MAEMKEAVEYPCSTASGYIINKCVSMLKEFAKTNPLTDRQHTFYKWLVKKLIILKKIEINICK